MVDNTARGAGQRILWALANGVPNRLVIEQVLDVSLPLFYQEAPAQ